MWYTCVPKPLTLKHNPVLKEKVENFRKKDDLISFQEELEKLDGSLVSAHLHEAAAC